jgi:hypothetical protein
MRRKETEFGHMWLRSVVGGFARSQRLGRQIPQSAQHCDFAKNVARVAV